MKNILSMAALEAAIQGFKHRRLRPLDGRLKAAQGEVVR